MQPFYQNSFFAFELSHSSYVDVNIFSWDFTRKVALKQFPIGSLNKQSFKNLHEVKILLQGKTKNMWNKTEIL